ncbi:nad-dependent epimerase/dehydratase / alpha/beta hydrolase [Paenibacillus alvei TS-15]|uniref:Nad-dependent epimerase/dehydratase / alpha/beta hydrolase n=1 Tax=Paenibacillus alvei TS-15 TaxID=1117108 RepID=S9SZ00_PAEAL|nr:alpha/beta fold hydrolase [Paenibacillus alvei]EPY09353.1 nad-dependent epimerase/dehydratase / alpha/beta hydrolase [Paenibacillus alvei TS-15]
MMYNKETILITGATGFIGREVIRQLKDGDERLLLLVRSATRAEKLFQQYSESVRSRIVFIEGDLEQEFLGLKKEDWQLARQSDVLIHAGGAMQITQSSSTAERTFLHGAQAISRLAEEIHGSKGLRRFIHVVGYMSPFQQDTNVSGLSIDDVSRFVPPDAAPYERMKFTADLWIRQEAARVGYSLSVVNPSTVIGARPTGSTPQLEGLGLLVKAVRSRKMPVIPGGDRYWLPLVTNDDVAKSIVLLAREKEYTTREPVTINLVGDKSNQPNMKELLGEIAQQLHVGAPAVSVPLRLLSSVMRFGGEKLTGIPSQSLAFVTDRHFDNASAKQLLSRTLYHDPLCCKEILPFVIADIDYRLTFPEEPDGGSFVHGRFGSMVAWVREGSGVPIVLLHGWLSQADDLLPLAAELHMRTGRTLIVPDLPGFGRSPRINGSNPATGIVDSVVEAIQHQGTVSLIGHSFGAWVANESAARLGDGVKELIMLQPVLERPRGAARSFMSRSRRLTANMLKYMPASLMKKKMLREGVFEKASSIPQWYVSRIMAGLRSPRIANANASVMHAIYHHLPEQSILNDGVKLASSLVGIVWGEKERLHQLPALLEGGERLVRLPYGHHFPLSHSEATASAIAAVLAEK